ncbi:MAG: hypothetical protein U0931_27475 [Vulcanimicrobiota bacterium]
MELDVQNLARVRQMALYFQQYRELPGVIKQGIGEGISSHILNHWDRYMRRYRELDDSPEDYDPRPGHVMLDQDVIRGGKVQASYEGDVNNGRISKFYLDFSGRGFSEEHLILTDNKLHTLTIQPCDEQFLLEATHWDRRCLLGGRRQRLVIGPEADPPAESDPPDSLPENSPEA